ncbi:MAG: hypothetical protein ABH848_04770 [Candidatus Omnitrophota bacterium]
MLDRKKTISLILIIVSILCINLSARAAEEEGLTPAQIKKELIRGFKKKLNDTSWEITLRNSAGQEEMDIVSFKDYKVVSRKMLVEGFNPSNFTVRMKGERKIIWETMQTSEKKGVAFWRGDIFASDIEKGAVMRGVLSWHIKDGVKRDYNFNSKEWDGEWKKEELAPKPVEETPIEEAVVEEAPKEETLKEEPEPEPEVKEEVKEPVQEAPKKEVKTPVPEKKKKKKAWWQ